MPIRTLRANILLGMPVAQFMREHWQKKPLLVRNALLVVTSGLTYGGRTLTP